MIDSPLSSDTVIYKPLGAVPPSQLAAFHIQNLGGKLTWLGLSYVRFFYETALHLDGVLGSAAFCREDLVGFVFGSLAGEKLLRGVMTKNPIGWMRQAVGSALRHPIAFGRVGWSVLASSSSKVIWTGPILHYIAVRSDQRGHHIGDGLMRQFGQDLLAMGHTSFMLAVGTDNSSAIRFYEAHRGRMVQEWKSAGVSMRQYAFDASMAGRA